MNLDFVGMYELSWCVANPEEFVLGVMVTSARSEDRGNDGCSVSPIMKSESYSSNTKQNDSTESLSNSFVYNYRRKKTQSQEMPQYVFQ